MATDKATASVPSFTIILEKVLRDLNEIRRAMNKARFNKYRGFWAVKVGFLATLTLGCFSSSKSPQPNNASIKPPQPEQAISLQLGISVFLKDYDTAEWGNLGIVANNTSRLNGVHLVDSLFAMKAPVQAIFAPEHGFRGNHGAGDKVEDAIDPSTGLKVHSLYGSYKKPSAEQLKDIETLLFDIQDVGARFYTYISTLHYIMEAAAENGIKVVVLDRPNPHGHYIDGPILEPEHQSFVGMHPVPVVHGMTIGEYAQMINGEGWLKNGITCDLQVVQMKGYDHTLHYELPIAPSPNLPNDTAITLYPSLCFFEGTVVSVGRGTHTPFQVVGMPGLSGPYTFTPVSMPQKARYPKFQNTLCHGFYLDSTYQHLKQQPMLDLSWLVRLHAMYKGTAPFFNAFFTNLAGTNKLQAAIESGQSAAEIRARWQDDLLDFQTVRKKYLLYPDF